MPSVLSVQVGRTQPLGPDQVPSAFVKRPITGMVHAERLGLRGDEQADLTVHGGPDKAIYFYPSVHYPLWLADVPKHERLLVPGGFGENVTTIGLDEHSVAIGDVLAIGTTELQVTQPRQPCFKLGLRFNDNSLGRIMMKSNRTGWYVRVLKSGDFQAGDEIRFVSRENPQWSIVRFNHAILRGAATSDDLEELSELEGLAEEWRLQIAQVHSK